MFIPLGLALKLREAPFITYLIICLCTGYYFAKSPLEKANQEIIKANLESDYFTAKTNLQYQFCLSKTQNENTCASSNKLFKRSLGEKDKDKSIDKNNTFSESEQDQKKDKTKFWQEFDSALSSSALVVEFNKLLQNKSSELANLESYNEFKRLENEYRKKIKNVHNKHGLLSKYNFSPGVILKAIFTHAGLMHLIGNMFMLFIFGRYVESRMGSKYYLISYLVPGIAAISLYTFFDSGLGDSYVVGASANVSVVMGLFYTLFFHSRMKFWIFYFAVKIVSFKVKTYFFLFYIILELLLSFSDISNIAHGAHALGLVFGALIGVIWLKVKPLPKHFIYDEEYEKWLSIKDSQDLDGFIRQADDLLKYNPDNYEIRMALITKLLQAQMLETANYKLKYHELSEQHLKTFIKTLKYHKMYSEFFDFLTEVPYSRRYTAVFHEINQKSLLVAIDKSIDENKLYASIRLINLFFEKYPNSKKTYGLKKTLDSIIENIEKTEKLRNMIQSLSLDSKSYPLKIVFMDIYNNLWRQYE